MYQKSLSFCVTCKNRLHQLQQTLPVNLRHNEKYADEIEFVIVDFNSDEAVAEWVISSFANELAGGYLSFYSTTALTSWHVSIAKNSAHLYAKGRILVNLDGDNFTGRDGAKFVLDQFDIYGRHLLLHQFSGDYSDGSCGRIALHRDYFYAAGGYDESFLPVGHDDLDLINRLHILGLQYMRNSNNLYNRTIPNTQTEGIKNANSGLSWAEMELGNSISSIGNINAFKLVANNGRPGIRHDVWRYELGTMRPMAFDHNCAFNHDKDILPVAGK